MKYRPDVDGLRAVAVTLVVLFHAGISRVPGGFVGVDVFFVISGFLITRLILSEINETGGFRFGNFYLRRVRRLGPALLVTCVGSFIAASLIFTPSSFAEFSSSMVAALTSTSNIWLWLQAGYFDSASATKPLLHTWSLSVEEQFYLIWPAILVGLSILGRRKPFAVPTAIAAIFVVSFAANIFAADGIRNVPWLTDHFADGKSLIFYLMPFRVFELAIGGGLHWVVDKAIPRLMREALLIVGLALILAAAVYFNERTLFPYWSGLLPCFGAAMVIVGGRGTYSGWIVRNPLAVGIGLISYSVYLIHWPLIVFHNYYYLGATSVYRTAFLCVAPFALAIPMYFFVERPFRRHRGPIALSSRQFLVGITASVAALIVVSYSATDGWWWRVPRAEILNTAMAQYGGSGCPGLSCEHGTAGKTVYVVGDSFSRHLYEGLTAEFPDQKFEFHDYSLCTMFSPTWSRWVDVRNHQQDCLALRKDFIDRVAGKKASVIFAINWVREDFFDVTSKEAIHAPQKHFELSAELAAFTYAEIAKQKEALGLAKVMVVANPPSIGEWTDLQLCLGRPIKVSSADCQHAPRKSVEYRRYLAADKNHPGTTVIDPFDAFCDAETCLNYTTDGPFYSDRWHLSRLGSRRLIAHFKNDIAAWIAGTANKPTMASR